MSEVIELDGKLLQPISEILSEVSYSRDYVTQLAREGKIFATQVGRRWFIDGASLRTYVDDVAMEQVVRREQLRKQRISERQLRVHKQGQQAVQVLQAQQVRLRHVMLACLVLLVGISGGVVVHRATWVVSSTDYVAKLGAVFAPTTHWSNRSVASVPQYQPAVAGAVVETSTKTLDVTGMPTIATKTVQSLGDRSHGVLLLPDGISATITDMFSDEVVVAQQVDGGYVVQQVDATGRVVAATEVPVVVVPVAEPEPPRVP